MHIFNYYICDKQIKVNNFNLLQLYFMLRCNILIKECMDDQIDRETSNFRLLYIGRASIPPQSLSMNLESLTSLVASAVRYRVLHWTLCKYISGRQNLHWRLSGSCVGLREENIGELGWSEKSLKFMHYNLTYPNPAQPNEPNVDFGAV